MHPWTVVLFSQFTMPFPFPHPILKPRPLGLDIVISFSKREPAQDEDPRLELLGHEERMNIMSEKDISIILSR